LQLEGEIKLTSERKEGREGKNKEKGRKERKKERKEERKKEVSFQALEWVSGEALKGFRVHPCD
jgi:hypothetical protein